MDLDTKTKLRVKLFIRQLSRKKLDSVYETFDLWTKERRKLAKSRADTTLIDYKLDELNKEIERIENSVE
jgi:hypothetical protein